MTPHPTDIIQSFRLRFWRESRRGISEDWRGEVWHEQQQRGEPPIVVTSPEAAFELVRQTLRFFSGSHDAGADPAKRPEEDEHGSGSLGTQRGTTGPKNPLLSIWHRIRGAQP